MKKDLAKLALVGVAILIAVVGVWWLLVGKPIHDKSEKVRLQAESAVGNAAADTARNAQNTTIGVGQREGELTKQQEETDRAIDNTANARDTAGDAGLAGLRVLCQRPAHRDELACRKLLEAR